LIHKLFSYSNLKVNATAVDAISQHLVQNIIECDQRSSFITVATVIDKPFTRIVKMDKDPLGSLICTKAHKCSIPTTLNNGTIVWEVKCCAGLVIDIIMEMKKLLHFDFRIYSSPDSQYGTLRNGTWTGMIKEVSSGRADLAIQGITINAVRSQAVDFTKHFMLTAIGIVRSRRESELPVVNWEFMKTLKADLLFGLVFSFALVFAFMFGYENMNYYLDKTRKYYPTREAFSYVAGLTFQRDLAGKTPNKWSARFVAIVYAIAMTIVMTTYTANLTANNLTQSDDDDFQGLKDRRVRIDIIFYKIILRHFFCVD